MRRSLIVAEICTASNRQMKTTIAARRAGNFQDRLSKFLRKFVCRGIKTLIRQAQPQRVIDWSTYHLLLCRDGPGVG
jgi:hypothetical protein